MTIPQFKLHGAAARAAHEANRALCILLGDDSQPGWDDAPSWQKESALTGVEAVAEGKTPEQLHESWSHYKLNTGWTYGEVKDSEARTHPCLVPYSELPTEQKAKDVVFSYVVTGFLKVAHDIGVYGA